MKREKRDKNAPSSQPATTVMLFSVSVPVLSEQIVVHVPMTSHLSMWRTRFCIGSQTMRQRNVLSTLCSHNKNSSPQQKLQQSGRTLSRAIFITEYARAIVT